VEGISKKFGLSLRAALKYGLIDGCRRLVGRESDHALRAGEFWALEGVTFSLQPGDALGIMGVNGSGKTTLLRILNGTYAPDKGLAVGDLSFQKKCYERIQKLRQQGTTILLVSHSSGAVWSVCNKGLLLNKGLTEGIVSVEDACREYDHVNMLSRVESSTPMR